MILQVFLEVRTPYHMRCIISIIFNDLWADNLHRDHFQMLWKEKNWKWYDLQKHLLVNRIFSFLNFWEVYQQASLRFIKRLLIMPSWASLHHPVHSEIVGKIEILIMLLYLCYNNFLWNAFVICLNNFFSPNLGPADLAPSICGKYSRDNLRCKPSSLLSIISPIQLSEKVWVHFSLQRNVFIFISRNETKRQSKWKLSNTIYFSAAYWFIKIRKFISHFLSSYNPTYCLVEIIIYSIYEVTCRASSKFCLACMLNMGEESNKITL